VLASVLWRRIDPSGHDAVALRRSADGWELAGAALFTDERGPCRLEYSVACDDRWRTRRCTVTGSVGRTPVQLAIAAAEGRWTLDGRYQPEVEGCVDLDLAFTPATNTLPIRRLGLEVGQSASVRAAWLPWPPAGLQLLEQQYRRTLPEVYRYESEGGRFVRDLVVHSSGLVTSYPGLWEAEAAL
jgi:uncharacterized protein